MSGPQKGRTFGFDTQSYGEGGVPSKDPCHPRHCKRGDRSEASGGAAKRRSAKGAPPSPGKMNKIDKRR